jgi:tetratricopeptide (TPR) repeat protein
MSRLPLLLLPIVALALSLPSAAQLSELDQIQVAPPMRQIQPPSTDASVQELEKTGDELRSRKAYLDAIDYYEAAEKKAPENAALYNKVGIAQLMLQRFREAGKNFDQAIKYNRKFADAYNNRGVVEYERKKYHGAIKQYKKALQLDPDSASFYSNLGAAYFANKKFEEASQAYAKALQLDPDIFEHTSRAGITAQIASAEDRAHYEYVLAKLFAKMGDPDHSLEHLRKAMEEGYKKVNDVYTDPEFANLRKDARFEELMKEHPAPLPE